LSKHSHNALSRVINPQYNDAVDKLVISSRDDTRQTTKLKELNPNSSAIVSSPLPLNSKLPIIEEFTDLILAYFCQATGV